MWSSVFCFSAPSLEIELSLPGVRRTILLLSSSEYVSDIVFFDARIFKTASNTSAQHALGQWFSIPRSRNFKMYTGGDTTRFLDMWLVDSSHRNTVSRVLPSRGKIVKHWPVRGYKRVGVHCLSVYLSNTYCRYKRLFGIPIAFSGGSLWKIGPIFFDLLQTFSELMRKGDFKLRWFPERSHSSINKNSHFLGLEKVITCVMPNDCRREAVVFSTSEDVLAPPYLTAINAWSGSVTALT